MWTKCVRTKESNRYLLVILSCIFRLKRDLKTPCPLRCIKITAEGSWILTSPWILVNSWQTWIISPQTQASRSIILQRFIRAISFRPGVGIPFSLFFLIKICEVLMLPSSPPCLRELFLLCANMNHKGNEEIISIIPLSYCICWCYEASCKQESTGRGPQAILARPRVWFRALSLRDCSCPILHPLIQWGIAENGCVTGGSRALSSSADPLLTPLPLVHNPSRQLQESSLVALWLSGWVFLAVGFLT